jgi:hypothetical protein
MLNIISGIGTHIKAMKHKWRIKHSGEKNNQKI